MRAVNFDSSTQTLSPLIENASYDVGWLMHFTWIWILDGVYVWKVMEYI